MITICNTRPEHIAQLVEHQRICFPTLSPEDLMQAEMFAAQLAVFPEGQHIALDGERVVGQSSTFRIGEEQCRQQHTYRAITGKNSFSQHNPQGRWLYGADMSVHPAYRGRGIATMLYGVRKELVRRLKLKGIVFGGAMPGYGQHADHLSVDAYIAEVVAGRLNDPTITPQLKNGFVVRGVLRNYVDRGAASTGDATWMWWEDCVEE
ncbi:GNAT family N-acetyltransferase [Candidatus Chloroploca asiatica]|uniref:GCN5 family acetyltransferase n=1 Tax=Candidatus Chloroploca asiatica TaxID=1506545 RepID=A0A2H3KN52_9CHLR|nr:GNAT family N-acetyltransferase [Candidatus Chloroploca asiatica]PDV99591.1 GCN5 family acetyltransferase [Candidatus Chloroploca asiatica]